jgi:Domain of unknown function (DUF4294)
MAKKVFFFVFMWQVSLIAQNQNQNELEINVPFQYVRTTVYNGDTIPYVTLHPIVCYADRPFRNYKQKVAWDRLKYNVKKVYPYAILASAKLKEYDLLLSKIQDKKERERYTKKVEKQLKAEFGKELENLTVTQGRLLVKLIDRETGKTTYNIVKEMRGSFSAFMWQSVAIMFSSNLKSEYDAMGQDKAIEEAIKLIENGDF